MKKKLQTQLQKIEREIEEAEKNIAALDVKVAAIDYSDAAASTKVLDEYASAKSKLDGLYEQWEEVSSEIN